MAWCMYGVKPLSEQVMVYCLLIGPLETNLSDILSNILIWEKHLKCCLQNGSHFVSILIFWGYPGHVPISKISGKSKKFGYKCCCPPTISCYPAEGSHSFRVVNALRFVIPMRKDKWELNLMIKVDDIFGIITALQWGHNEWDGISNHQPYSCLINRLFWRRLKETSKLCVTGLCEGNSPVTSELSTQRASNMENISHLMTSSW